MRRSPSTYSFPSLPYGQIVYLPKAPLPYDGHLSIGYRFTQDGFSATYVTLRQCIEAAYDVPLYSRISGPSWITSDSARYLISAKAAGRTTEAELRRMLQSLLADKFALRLHTEPREGLIYALLSNGKPLKMKSVDYQADDRDYGMRPTRQGLEAIHTLMDVLAQFLSGPLVGMDRPVLDMTGITGLFDFTLQFAKSPQGKAALDATSDSELPLIFESIQALGLKLDARKGAITHYVVDSAVKWQESK